MEAQVFSQTPSELRTIEVDVEKKIFNVNGVPFGENCTAFYISCEAADGYKVRLEINTNVILQARYNMNGRRLTMRLDA